MKKKHIQTGTRKLALSAMFIAIGLVLPFLTGQIPYIASMLLPMHIPVLLCGLICGWKYGLFVGFTLPLLRCGLFGMPAFYSAIAMAFELATYGAVSGFLYARSRWQSVRALYRCLVAAMMAGRLVWGVVRVLMSGVAGQAFTWKLFLSGALLNAIPGIVLQLVLIPAVMLALHKTGMVKFYRESPALSQAEG